jgi:hypothetical protein
VVLSTTYLDEAERTATLLVLASASRRWLEEIFDVLAQFAETTSPHSNRPQAGAGTEGLGSGPACR